MYILVTSRVICVIVFPVYIVCVDSGCGLLEPF